MFSSIDSCAIFYHRQNIFSTSGIVVSLITCKTKYTQNILLYYNYEKVKGKQRLVLPSHFLFLS